MRIFALTAALLLIAAQSRAQLPELGGMYMGVAYTTNKNTYPEIKGGHLPGDQINHSFFIPHTSLQYDNNGSWWEYKMTPIYWDIVAMLTTEKDNLLENTLFSSGILGHFTYGRTISESDRLRTSWGLGIGEYGLESGSLSAGYFFTVDLAAKFDVLLTDSMVLRVRPRYDIAVGSLPTVVSPVEDSDLAKPHFFALDVMLLTSSKFYLGLEYWKILPRNSDANRQIHFDSQSHKYASFGGVAPETPPDLSSSRLQMHVGLKFYSVDDW